MKDAGFRLSFSDLRLGKFKIITCLWFIVSLAFISTGCTGSRSSSSSDMSKNLATVKSVCLIELQNKTAYPPISGDVTESLYQSMQKKQRFTLSLLKQTDAAWAALEVRPDSPSTLEQLLDAHKLLDADAIIIGTVTSYSPYPHMAMGLKLKLIDLRTGQTIWSIEQIWDSADKNTQERIKKYYEQKLRSDFSTIGEKLATVSAINFIRFITYEVIETM